MYNRFAERIDELELQGDVDAKPILDVRSATMMCCHRVPILCVGLFTGSRGRANPRRLETWPVDRHSTC